VLEIARFFYLKTLKINAFLFANDINIRIFVMY